MYRISTIIQLCCKVLPSITSYPGACRLALRAASPSPGPCDPRCGGLSVRAAGCGAGAHRSQGRVRGPGWGLPTPTQLRGQNTGPAGTSPGAFVGPGFPGTSCPARGRSGCGPGPGGPSQPQAGLAGCRGRGRLPRMVVEPRASQPPSCTFTLFLNLPLG